MTDGSLQLYVASVSDYAVNCTVQETHIWSKGQPYCSTSACSLSGHPCSIQHRLHRCSTGNQTAQRRRYDLTRHLQPASAPLSLCLKPSFSISSLPLISHFTFPPDWFHHCQRASLNCCCDSGIYVLLKRRRDGFFEFSCRLSVLSARQFITYVAAAVPALRGVPRLRRLCGNQLCPACRDELLHSPLSPAPFTAIRSLQSLHFII